MGIVSFRLDDARQKRLSEIFAYYGFTSENATDNYRSLFDMLYELMQNHKNSQTVSDGLAEHQTQGVDVACNCRISVPKLVRALDAEGQPCWKEQPVLFCVQWQAGKLKRQLRLESLHTCEICKLLTAKWLEEQQEQINEKETAKPNLIVEKPQVATPLFEPIQTQPAPTPTTHTETNPKIKIYTPIKDWQTDCVVVRADGAKVCPYDATYVYPQTDCKRCKRDENDKWSQCALLFLSLQHPKKP